MTNIFTFQEFRKRLEKLETQLDEIVMVTFTYCPTDQLRGEISLTMSDKDVPFAGSEDLFDKLDPERYADS